MKLRDEPVHPLASLTLLMVFSAILWAGIIEISHLLLRLL